jgi:3-oxoadipate enol-lactonase
MYTETGGNKIFYEVRGAGDPVILLNGAMANTTSWNLQLPALLANNYKVILMDFVGQGQSDKPRTKYRMIQHIDEVAAVLDAVGVEKAHYVGVSYGGEVALLCGINAPKRIRSLVVANSVSSVDRSTKGRADRWLLAARFRSGRMLWQMVYPDLYSSSFLEKNWDFVAKTAPSFDLLDFDAFIEILKAFMELDVTDQLGKITVPALVLTSDEDGTKPERYSEIMHEKMAGSEIKIIHGAGHLAMWEKPEEFNGAILEFLSRHR